MLDTIGFFKASDADPGDMLGYGVSISDNGRTLAVAAIGEASKAAGVNGNRTDNSSPASARYYVFRHTSSGWRQEAYLKAGVNQPQQFFGGSFNFGHESLALNADGTLWAVGAAEQDVNGIQDTGAVSSIKDHRRVVGVSLPRSLHRLRRDWNFSAIRWTSAWMAEQ